jgi:hypothetical protein
MAYQLTPEMIAQATLFRAQDDEQLREAFREKQRAESMGEENMAIYNTAYQEKKRSIQTFFDPNYIYVTLEGPIPKAPLYGTGSTPKASRKRKTRANEEFDSLSIIDKDFLLGIVDDKVSFIPLELRNRIQKIFYSLDTNEDGVLSSVDFTSKHPKVSAALAVLWESLLERSDYDSDGQITPKEFVCFFVFLTLDQIYGDLGVGRDQPVAQNLKLIHILERLHKGFAEGLENVIVFMEYHITNLI